MKQQASSWLRRLAPWAISAAALVYVFGYAIDFKAIPEATGGADLPLFIAITVFDKIVFFLVWGYLQWLVIARFFEPVSLRRVLAVKGGSELMRSINNSLADATFFLGVSQLVHQRLGAAVGVALIPFGAHFFVLLVQATLALPLLEGGYAAHRDVYIALAITYTVFGALYFAYRSGRMTAFFRDAGTGDWIERVTPRALLPFVGWFACFAVFDVFVQGFASRAFGVEIAWVALMARIPLLYFALTIPSLGNFGTREIAWANLFEGFGTREELIAFALWTNAIFLVMHVIIGAIFFSTALALVRDVRKARGEGATLPGQLIRDASDA